MGTPILGILKFPLGNPWTKWHLGASPMDRHRVYYKGEGGGFPQVLVMVSFVSSCLPVVHPCTKSVSCALTNLLFGLCKFMWVIDLLIILPSPYPRALARPSTPEVLRVRERASTPYPSAIFTFWFAIESTKEFGGASRTHHHLNFAHSSFEVFRIEFNSKSIYVGCHSFAYNNYFFLREP